jgi:hypothetical protein
VRKGPSGAVQLVLLDHGLYRQIDDDFRREYAALWRALILADKQGIKRHAEGMNAGDAYPLFAAMLTMRPWDQVGRKVLTVGSAFLACGRLACGGLACGRCKEPPDSSYMS